MCNMCVDGIDGIICVKCTESDVQKFVTSNIDRYHTLFNQIMTSKSNTDNLKHAIDTYIVYIQNNSSIPLMSVTNAKGECYMATNAFGDINYSSKNRFKT